MSKRTKSTALTLPERAKQALATVHTEEQLTALAKATETITEITNQDGREQVHTARMLLKNTRVAIEKVGNSARDDARKFCKAVVTEENRLVMLIEPEECRLEDLQRAWDAEREREKQTAIEAELRRVEGIQERIAELRGNRRLTVTDQPGLIKEHITDLERMSPDDSFGEFIVQAVAARDEGLIWLRTLHAQAVTYHIEQERISKDREELERLRAENDALKAEQERQAAERHRSGTLDADWKRDNAITRDLLSLTDQGRFVPLYAVEHWTDEQCQLAEEWAGAAHTHASDNDDVIVPPIPAHVAQWDTPEARERITREDDKFWGSSSPQPAPPSKPSDRDIIAVLAAYYRVPPATIIEWILSIDFSELEAAA